MVGACSIQKDSVRVEFQISPDSELLKKAKDFGDLRKEYPTLEIIKYIYLDPKDNKLKGVSPPDETPLIGKAYITIAGDWETVIKFSKTATQ